MKHDRGWGFRGAIVAAALGQVTLAAAAQAQASPGSEAPGVALRRQVAELAANPTSVTELVETGRAALAVGDGEGALGFFTRANQLAPRDARVTAGLASANVFTGRPETALLLFTQAASLGAPEVEIAADRGLAYDLLGQTARAQQDYLVSLRHRGDAEVRRRMALSLAISGQREAALRLVDDQARPGDRAGQRARVMVLALSGDVRGATDAANASLPRPAAQSLTPFLARLAALSPGDKASAANLGRVPSGYRPANAAAPATADPSALAFAGGGTPAPAGALASRLPVAPVSAEAPRRRSGGVVGVAGNDVRTPERGRVLASAAMPVARSAPVVAAPNGLRIPHPNQPLRHSAAVTNTPSEPLVAPVVTEPSPGSSTQTAALTIRVPADDGLAGRPASSGGPTPAAESPTVALTTLQPAPAQPRSEPQPQHRADPSPQLTDGSAANLAVWNTGSTAAASNPAPYRPSPVSASPQLMAAAPAAAATSRVNRPGFSDVVATVSSLAPEAAAPRGAAPAPSASRLTPAREPVRRPDAMASARTPATRPPAAATSASHLAPQVRATRTSAALTRPAAARPAAHPQRHWVQLGVAPNRTGFTYEMNRMRAAAPALRSQTAHTAPIGSNHRLLVGPFPTEAAARSFVGTLRQNDVPAMTWTSPTGTEVTRFGGR